MGERVVNDCSLAVIGPSPIFFWFALIVVVVLAVERLAGIIEFAFLVSGEYRLIAIVEDITIIHKAVRVVDFEVIADVVTELVAKPRLTLGPISFIEELITECSDVVQADEPVDGSCDRSPVVAFVVCSRIDILAEVDVDASRGIDLDLLYAVVLVVAVHILSDESSEVAVGVDAYVGNGAVLKEYALRETYETGCDPRAYAALYAVDLVKVLWRNVAIAMEEHLIVVKSRNIPPPA